jgi:hypothetical protein
MICLLSLVAASAGAASVVISQRNRVSPVFKITVRDKGRDLWSDVSDAGFAVAVPRRKLILFCACREQGSLLVARGYRGRVLWEGPQQEIPWDDVHAGGDILLIQPPTPAAGIAINDVRNWNDILGDGSLVAFDLATRRDLWESNTRDMGYPIWTNGSVFLAVRLDLSPPAIQRLLRRRARLPVWLEQRRVKDRKLLWRRRLRGYPPGLTQARAERGGHLGLWLADRREVPYGYGTFPRLLRYLKPLYLSVPVYGGSLPAAGQDAVVYRKRYR